MGSTYEENVRPRDDISITKHGLKVPAYAEDYESFVTRMKTSECDFRETFAVQEVIADAVSDYPK